MCSNVYVSFKIAFCVSKFLHICCSVDWIINIYQCKFKFCVAIVLLPSENKLGLWIVPYKNTIISCISFKWFREESQKVRSAVMLILWSHAEILKIAPLTAAEHFYVYQLLLYRRKPCRCYIALHATLPWLWITFILSYSTYTTLWHSGYLLTWLNVLC